MLTGSMLLKLPSDWQLKMHNEIASKLKLCISDTQIAQNIATETLRYISQDNFDKNELSLKLKPYLSDHAPDFTEWVSDFAQKSLEYYVELFPNAMNDESTPTSLNMNNDLVNENVKGKNKKFNVLLETNSLMFKKAMNDLKNQNSFNTQQVDSLDNSIDPLDQPLDSLIKKEKIAKLQGKKNISLGVQTKSEKFKPTSEPEFDNSRRMKSKPTFYKNLTLVNVDNATVVSGNSGLSTSLSSSSVGSFTTASGAPKVPKMCMNFPNCQYGENCRYIHPNKVCKNWPDCFYGDKCAFIHPSN